MYASVDGGPFAPWFTNTTATSGTYVGAVGHTYGFFSVARDRVGHTEGGTSAAEASIDVVLECESTAISTSTGTT